MDSAQPSLNDFFSPWKVSFEKSAALWGRQFETAERIGTANASAFKAVFDASSIKTLHQPEDQENVLAFARSLAQLMTEAATIYPKLMSEIASEANGDLSAIAIKYVNRLSDVQVAALDKMADKAPAGVDAVFKALSQVIATAAANQAYLLETFLPRNNVAEHAAPTKGHKKDLPAVIESE